MKADKMSKDNDCEVLIFVNQKKDDKFYSHQTSSEFDLEKAT